MKCISPPKQVSNLLIIVTFLTMLVFSNGCTIIPTPIRLVNKPRFAEKKPNNNIKVCLVVKDERPESIRKINMSGITRTTIFLIPSSFVFLAHTEHLDSIVSHHVKASLENEGLTVVRSYPAAPDVLSSEEIDPKSLSEEDKKNAWAQKDTQDDKNLRKKEASSNVEDLEEYVPTWGSEVDTSGCDVIVEVKIRKFWTDYNYWGSFSWMSANFALCKLDGTDRKVLFGKKAKGIGYMFSALTPLTPAADVPVSQNASYWFVLHSIEKMINSEEFQSELNQL